MAAGDDVSVLHLWRLHRGVGSDAAQRSPAAPGRDRVDERSDAAGVRGHEPRRCHGRWRFLRRLRLAEFLDRLWQFPHAVDATHRLSLRDIRGGLAQVTTVFSMFFSGMSGSSSADVAVLSRTMARPMAKEGYSPAFVAALIAAASTIANLVPPSIMAVVYGAVGNVSIAGLFLAGILPGLMVGAGLMLFCYFFGPVGFRRPRSSFRNLVAA